MSDVPVLYLPPGAVRAPGFARPDIADWMVANADWEERTSARYECFYSTIDAPYTYGKGAGRRTYHPRPMPYWLRPVQAAVEARAGAPMQLCFLNRYDHEHQHLGWHADDSPEQDDAAPIVVQSYGAERELWVRENGTGGAAAITRFRLEHGSTLIMLPGMQRTHQHRIPKHPEPCGVRVSLTWRSLKGVA